MYAALVHLTIDPASAPAAAEAFSKDILPEIQRSAGFIAGYWVDPEDGKGFGFILFETEAQARRATPPEAPWPAPGVKIASVDIRRVAVAIPEVDNTAG